MSTVLLIAYGVYLTLVGVKGNGSALLNDLQSERQFLYWLLVILVIIALWESPYAETFSKSFAVLIVLGFLLHNSNYKKIGAGITTTLTSTAAASPVPGSTTAASAASSGGSNPLGILNWLNPGSAVTSALLPSLLPIPTP